MVELNVKIYNVRFGDAIFISVPDEDENGNPKTRYILIDVGNVQDSDGGYNDVFKPVVDDILSILNGSPLDLYVMTHEHLDHVQGLLWTAKQFYSEIDLTGKLNVRHSWLPVSSEPGYYDNHENARKKNNMAADSFMGIHDYMVALGVSQNRFLDILIKNNNRFLPSSPVSLSSNKTSDCVEYLRKLAGDKTHYVYRSIGKESNGTPLCNIENSHNFRNAQFEIWAPEEDSSDYYGTFTPMAFGMQKNIEGLPKLINSAPPHGVDASAFFNLIKFREGAIYDNLLAIDKAANNTSIVFCIKWQGWTLLFPGDAEERSWKEMNKHNVFSPTDFLKISHHGSENGTPEKELLNKLFPDSVNKEINLSGAVSTYLNTYSGIPDKNTTDELEALGIGIHSTLNVGDGEALEFKFKPKSNS